MSHEPDGAPAAVAARRLHPTSFLFDLLTHARGLVLPALVLLVTARWTNTDLFFAPIAVVMGVIALARQLSLSYEIRETDLVVRRSLVIHRSERHIPFARVHNLKTSATPIHRWLGVVEVAIETASGAEPEATLRVLSEDALAELRSRVAGRAPVSGVGNAETTAATTPPARDVLVAMSPHDLVFFGVLNNRGLVIAGAIAGLGWEAAAVMQGGMPWDPRAWTTPWTLVRARGRDLLAAASDQSIVVLVLIAVGGLVLLKLFSVAWALVSLHRFQVERNATSLVVERGLFPRTSTSIPFTRIQRIVVRDRPLLRLAGQVEVQLDTVGGSHENRTHDPVWLAPLLPREQLPALLQAVGLAVTPDEAPWQPLHPRAARRIRTRLWIVMAIGSAPLWPMAGWRATLAALAVGALFAPWLARRQAGAMRYAAPPAHVLLQTGWLRRTLLATWTDRVQSVTVAASPFDRRHGMASVLVDTAAGGTLDTRMEIPFLGEETARLVGARLASEAAGTRFEW